MVRIISGIAGGIPIKVPPTDKTKPTLDRVKESVFSILQPCIPGTQVLDLFAGSGSLGLEALSRGADFAVFVDSSRLCTETIRENIEKTRMSDKAQVVKADVYKAIRDFANQGRRFDIILMDPPYSRNFVCKTLQMIVENDIIIENGVVAVEHIESEPLPDRIGRLGKVRSKHYGDTVFTFYVLNSEDGEA
ncbi:MAG TPA: 16S rRNA (guanine(966)-N(2))-methyltransferase RsmD [Thermoclostridium sp.]|nr:16S rRNA (guanine(966)-N(2))-methyltransferase RsmD [Clostridiaceae bacterium]HOQ76715.1 16S rRNA (guanine(966)-N(2))-methyltransferase RsmD [Thermoclostridium sp.]HPU45905.1 16S rRNA (guanine(966)-N(2))-methyltransferase RsmD [Thermoclostridium sp.]